MIELLEEFRWWDKDIEEVNRLIPLLSDSDMEYGIIAKGIENTLKNVGILGSEGMKQTDQTILDIMLESPKAVSSSGCKRVL